MARQIYFAGSMRGGRQDVLIYGYLIKLLEQYGRVQTKFVGDERITVKDEGLDDFDSEKRVHDDDIRMLSECDCFVAEVTQISLGVGYEIGRAVEKGKPVLCLYRLKDKDTRLSAMIRGIHTGDRYIVVDYEKESELPDILAAYFLNYSRNESCSNSNL